MIRGIDKLAQQYGLDTKASDRTGETTKRDKKAKMQKQQQNVQVDEDEDDVPRMYRAQTEGRCHLQYANDNLDLERWSNEWITLDRYHAGHPVYQYPEPPLGLQGSIYRIKIQFPFRVFSNCGQDSIHRPVLGKNGIPFIPGSSVKGIFRRLLYTPDRTSDSQQEIEAYCGNADRPGTLRFHGAYPVGDWVGVKRVVLRKRGERIEETRYQLVDLVHPQEKRQVETGQGKTSAYALISLYQPTMIFELSSSDSNVDWQAIGGLLRTALRPGLGGKTSTGYGLVYIPKNRYSLSIRLHGIGVTPQLRSNEPEFRPNIFKATLRSHTMRLLGGVCRNSSDTEEKRVRRKVEALFGSHHAPGSVELFWNTPLQNNWEPTYEINGTLNVDASGQDLEFLKWVLKFAYVMGGFGKSWRRVDHHRFYERGYSKLIGCHWECDPDDPFTDWLAAIRSSAQLATFLDDLQKQCCQYFQVEKPQPLAWKEAWHESKVAVFYAKPSTESKAISLFHQTEFKTTPAIGGRKPDDDRPTSVSCVWHRMLPIGKNASGQEEYLEIVTVFHGDRGDRTPWNREGKDQLKPFIEALKKQGLTHTWGTEPSFPKSR